MLSSCFIFPLYLRSSHNKKVTKKNKAKKGFFFLFLFHQFKIMEKGKDGTQPPVIENPSFSSISYQTHSSLISSHFPPHERGSLNLLPTPLSPPSSPPPQNFVSPSPSSLSPSPSPSPSLSPFSSSKIPSSKGTLQNRVVQTCEGLPPVRNHTMVYSQLSRSLVIFGGWKRTNFSQTHLTPINEMHFWSLQSKTWTSLPPSTLLPSPRYCHTCSVWQILNQERPLSRNPRKMNPPSPSLSPSSTQETPSPPSLSSSLSSSSFGKEMMICFGGIEGSGQSIKRLNDVWFFDFGNLKWSLQNCQGEGPQPLSHATSAIYGNTFIVFGGLSVNGERSNETWFLDLPSLTWSLRKTTGQIPLPRLSTTSSIYRHYLVLFGGYIKTVRVNDVYLLDLRTLIWEKPLLKGTPPVPRFDHGHVAIGSKIFIYGGSDGLMHLSDLWMFDVRNLEWVLLFPYLNRLQFPPSHAPVGDSAHTMVAAEGTLFIFGKTTENARMAVLSAIPFTQLTDTHLDPLEDLENDIHQKISELTHDFPTLFSPSFFSLPSPLSLPPSSSSTISSPPSSPSSPSSQQIMEKISQLASLLLEQHELLDQKHKRLEKEYTKKEKSLFNQLRSLEEEKVQMAKYDIGKFVVVNVGGKRFETTLSTLTSYHPSFLSVLFSGRYQLLSHPKDGSIFIDRDGTHFRYILNFLRDRSCVLPADSHVREELLVEARYYQLSELVDLLSSDT